LGCGTALQIAFVWSEMFASQAVLAKFGSYKDGQSGGFDHPLARTQECVGFCAGISAKNTCRFHW